MNFNGDVYSLVINKPVKGNNGGCVSVLDNGRPTGNKTNGSSLFPP